MSKRVKFDSIVSIFGSFLVVVLALTPVFALTGDIDGDGDVDRNDLLEILAARNTPANPGDPRDIDGDGLITGLDARKLTLQCTLPRCTVIDPPPLTANPDSNAIDEDTLLNVAAPGVLGNDTPFSNLLSVAAFDSVSANGAAVNVNNDGSYNYDPRSAQTLQDLNDNESIIDTFDYTATNPGGETSTTTVSITVNGITEPVACTPGIITTVAGSGLLGFGGDNGPALQASFTNPTKLAVDNTGDLFIMDKDNFRVRRVDAITGVITTVAGDGFHVGSIGRFTGDGGPATQASFSGPPQGLDVDGAGNIYIADTGNNRIRHVNAATGIITTVAGNGVTPFGGDGGPATAAGFSNPLDVAVDGSGNFYIVDANNFRIRRVDAQTGIITTVAGGGTVMGDGIPATDAILSFSTGVAVDSAGNIFIAENASFRVRRVDAITGLITTVAGSGEFPIVNNQDGLLATNARIQPLDLEVDQAGNLFIDDAFSNRIWRVDAVTGIINGVAGDGGSFNPLNDGDLATAGSLFSPQGVTLDNDGNIYISVPGSQIIRKVSACPLQ